MKLVVKLDYSTAVAFPAEQAGVLVPALSTGVIVTENYASKTFKPQTDRVFEFTFEPDTKFEEAPEVFVKLQQERDASEKKYLEQWRRGEELKKEVAGLKAEIERMRKAIGEPAAAKAAAAGASSDDEIPY